MLQPAHGHACPHAHACAVAYAAPTYDVIKQVCLAHQRPRSLPGHMGDMDMEVVVGGWVVDKQAQLVGRDVVAVADHLQEPGQEQTASMFKLLIEFCTKWLQPQPARRHKQRLIPTTDRHSGLCCNLRHVLEYITNMLQLDLATSGSVCPSSSNQVPTLTALLRMPCSSGRCSWVRSLRLPMSLR